jgi:2-methylisocitrate lyase-like PEP mutase family enzyme
MIIARTDCAASLGLDHAIERARAFITEGADAVFVELKPSPNAVEMIRRIKDEVKSTCMFNVDVGGTVSELKAAQMKSLGIDIAIHPSLGRGIFGYAMQQALTELKSSGSIAGLRHSMLTSSQYNAALGLANFEEWEKKFFD